MINREDLIKIVNAGILAPSGDNSQPWQIYFDGEKLYLKNLEYRDRSLYNVKNIASYIAFGAMIENMTIMAKSLGYEMSIKLFPEGGNSPIVAILSFVRGQVILDPLLSFINKRCVNRKKYKPKQLEPQVREFLLKVITGFKGAELYLIEDEEKKKKLAKIFSLNDKILFENKNLHDFLFKHLRWSREEVESSRDGMSIESLEIGSIQSKIFRLLSSWNLIRFLNIFGFSHIVPLRSYKLCKSSSALCLLLMKDTGFNSFINGGRVFQRIWLTATSLDLSLHPMTGITFLIQRLHMANGKDLSITHQRLLMDLEEQLKRFFPINRDKSMIMAFRLGYADPPSDKSLRLPVDKVLVEGNPIFETRISAH
jgi:hypothetical protein